MSKLRSASGFTIVETMIVLAVTAVLLISSTLAWSGRQRSSMYQSAVEDVRTRTAQAYSDVDNGFFPSTSSFGCTSTVTALTFATSGSQGTSSGCVFMGKAMQFKVGSASTNPETINLMTVAGRKIDGASLTTSLPTIAPALTESQVLDSDLETVRINVNGTTGYVGVAFLMSQGTITSGGLQSGRQPVKVYAIPGSFGVTTANVGAATQQAGKPLSGTNALVEPNTNGVRICFKSRGTSNWLLLTIGANGAANDIKTSTSTTTNCGI